MRFAQVFLAVVGVLFAVFGGAYLWWPAELAEAGGLRSVGPEGLVEIRAMYGGLQVGFGFFLLWASAGRERVASGCLSLVWVMGTIALARAGGIAIEGHAGSFHVMALAFEVPVALVAWIAHRRSRQAERLAI